MKEIVQKALSVSHKIQSDARKYLGKAETPATIGSAALKDEIYLALQNISENLANSYLQVKIDLQESKRISWAGTAHEIREILTTLLRELAPDDEVYNQPWFKQESNTSGPTQKQRVTYVVQKNKIGSNEKKVIEQVDILEERIANLVRLTYARASDAAHTFKPKREVSRILKYFEAFAQDLLNL